MLITTWIDILSPDELDKIMERERRMRQRRVLNQPADLAVLETHARRERLVTQMLELEEEEIDLEQCTL